MIASHSWAGPLPQAAPTETSCAILGHQPSSGPDSRGWVFCTRGGCGQRLYRVGR